MAYPGATDGRIALLDFDFNLRIGGRLWLSALNPDRPTMASVLNVSDSVSGCLYSPNLPIEHAFGNSGGEFGGIHQRAVRRFKQ